VSAPEPELEPKQPDRSLGELIGAMTTDLSILLRKEVELAKVEITEEAQKAKAAGVGFAGAAASGLYAGFALVLALGFLIAELTPTWVGFLLVAIAFGVAAALLAKKGQEQLATVDPAPEETIETMKENAQWLSEQRN
jgi:hypothetical protein